MLQIKKSISKKWCNNFVNKNGGVVVFAICTLTASSSPQKKMKSLFLIMGLDLLREKFVCNITRGNSSVNKADRLIILAGNTLLS